MYVDCRAETKGKEWKGNERKEKKSKEWKGKETKGNCVFPFFVSHQENMPKGFGGRADNGIKRAEQESVRAKAIPAHVPTATINVL